MVDKDTKKEWLKELFPGIDWNNGEICSVCFNSPPSWSYPYMADSEHEALTETCDYCGAQKPGNTISPWSISDKKLKELMKKRVW